MPKGSQQSPKNKADSPPLLGEPSASDSQLVVSDDVELALAELDDEDDGSGSPNLGRILLGVFILVLCLILAGLVIITSTVKDLNGPLQEQATQLAETLQSTPPDAQEETNLRATLDVVRTNANSLGSLLNTLEPSYFNWAETMNYLGQYDPNTLAIVGIAEMNGGMVVNGQANSEETVMAYVDALRLNPQFSRVIIQSLTLRTISERATSGGETSQRQVVEFIINISIIRGLG
ncbi:MAG: PilN domain-containing protein [Chloroflexi bacterium]|uniref:PilN domain-containing protein n=1 Tax=Candidatus Flexifilum breve TaxID=3140694 RepID=UPI003134F6BF|nr:PilN domain-containing protein [Chloroflexota bacterium]